MCGYFSTQNDETQIRNHVINSIFNFVFDMCMYFFLKKVVTFLHVQLMEVKREMKKSESEERMTVKEKGGKKEKKKKDEVCTYESRGVNLS